MRWLVKVIKDNLRSIGELVRGAKEDAEASQDRLDQAEQKVKETLALLDARKQNIELTLQTKANAARSKE